MATVGQQRVERALQVIRLMSIVLAERGRLLARYDRANMELECQRRLLRFLSFQAEGDTTSRQASVRMEINRLERKVHRVAARMIVLRQRRDRLHTEVR